MTSYQKALLKIISNGIDPDDNSYDSLITLITQEELDNAYSQSYKVIDCLKLTDIHSIRPAKKISRIKEKKPHYQPNFKINSDFIGLRVNHDTDQIMDYILKLDENVRKHNGHCYYRYNIDDIVAVIYIYLPTIGYIVEMQVGSPFCFYVFRNDSKLRDVKNGVLETRVKSPIDFWDHDFYSTIKSKIHINKNYDWKHAVVKHYQQQNSYLKDEPISLHEKVCKELGNQVHYNNKYLEKAYNVTFNC